MTLYEFRDTFDLVEYCKKVFPKYVRSSNNIRINCPYHDDRNPSMIVDRKRAYCFTCGANVEAIDLVCKLEGRTREDILSDGTEIKKYVSKRSIKQSKTIYTRPHENYVNAGKAALWNNSYALDYLVKRGMSVQSIDDYNLGYIRPIVRTVEYPRFSFPCYDERGELISIVYRADPRYEPDSNRKYVIHPLTPATIFGLEKLASCRAFLYSGGQIDAILLNQYGFPSLGVSGEGTFKLEWTKKLRGLDAVYLILDNDKAGIIATKKLLDLLPNAVALEWPSGTDGYDAADLINDPDYGPEGIRWMLRNVGANEKEFRRDYGTIKV